MKTTKKVGEWTKDRVLSLGLLVSTVVSDDICCSGGGGGVGLR